MTVLRYIFVPFHRFITQKYVFLLILPIFPRSKTSSTRRQSLWPLA